MTNRFAGYRTSPIAHAARRPPLARAVLLLVLLLAGGWAGVSWAQERSADPLSPPGDEAPDDAGELTVALPEPPVSLRPGFVAGRETRYRFWVQRQRDRSVRVAGREQNAQLTLTSQGELTWTVEEVGADGGAVCLLQYENLSVEVSANGGEAQRFDSDGTGEGPLLELIEALTDNGLTFDVAADGSIESVRGRDQLVAAVSDESAVPEEQEFIETASRLATLLAAPGEADTGEVWRSRAAYPHPRGELDHDMTFTLTGLDLLEGVPVAFVNMEADSDLVVAQDQRPTAPPGGTVDFNVTDIGMTGQAIFDLERGEVAGRNTQLWLEVRVELTGQTPRGPLTIVQVEREDTQAQLLRLTSTNPQP